MSEAFPIHEHSHLVPRTARSFVVGGTRDLDECWFVLHGYAELAREFLAPFVPLATERRRIVAPEGLSRFYRRSTHGDVGASWMTKVAREDEIADHVRQLEQVRHDALHAHQAAKTKLLGFSQGVATVCRWYAKAEFEAERIVLWGGGVPPDLEQCEYERLAGSDLIVVIGNDDRYLREEVVKRELARMAEKGLKPTLVRFDGGHEIDPQTLADVLN